MSTTPTLNPAREQNRDALVYGKAIDLDDLSGFQLPVDVTEEFLARVQNQVDILNMADTMTLERLEMEVPKFGVPQLSGAQRDEETSRTDSSDADSGEVKFNATNKSYYILVEPNRDALKNTHLGPDQFGEFIVNEFIQRWANDVSIIGIRANAQADTGAENLENTYDEVDSSTLDDTWDGWIAIAEGEDSDSDRIGLEETPGGEVDSMPDVDASGDPIDTELFNDSIQELDSRFRNRNNYEPVFLTSPNQVQQYHFDLTQREDNAGVMVLLGDGDVTPFNYDVVGIPEWPDSYMMLTDPDNLAYGLFEQMEVDQTTDTDKVHEDRLHSRNWLEGQFDFQIKELQAGVLVTNIQDPVT